jgi:hypothetical protein
METFAYLHVAQAYEDPELKELIGLDLIGVNQGWLECVGTLTHSRTGAIALLSLLCTAPWAAVASAASYVGYPSGYVTIRPDGDPGAVIQPGGCTLLPNPCSEYRPVYPNRPVYPVRPRPVYPDPDYRPVRPAPSGGMFLRRGDTGTEVRYVQDLLRSAGYFDATSTGFYATLTESGVKAFQQDYGLGVDGIVGAETLAALEGRG